MPTTGKLAAPVLRTLRHSVPKALRRLRAVVLLDGTVRRSELGQAIDRSLLELPIDGQSIVLDMWRENVAALREVLDDGSLRCRLMVGKTTRPPALRRQDVEAGISVETDPTELRGTGGVLHDVAAEYGEDDTLLVANAAQLLVEPLHELANELAKRGGDVTVTANGDGTPSSLALVSVRALRQLPKLGFVDLKEQGLPLMAKTFEVTTLWRAIACGLPIRTPRDYLAAVRSHHRVAAGALAHEQPFDERWRMSFSLIEEGAMVSPDATLHDAVVLRGGQVAAGALVADSLICGGAVIKAKENVVRRVVSASKRVSIEARTA